MAAVDMEELVISESSSDDQDIDYGYLTADLNNDRDHLEFGRDQRTDENLRFCPKCNKIYEHRYEQQAKGIVCYIYTQLDTWAFRVPKCAGSTVPERRSVECKSEGCSGDYNVIIY